jgi:hypothetical protein
LLIAREIGDQYNETSALINLGAAQANLGHHDSAIEYTSKLSRLPVA